MSLLTKIVPTGRKYRLALICILCILACFGLAGINPILLKVFAEVVGGIVGVFIVYCGGNVATKGVLGKWQGATVDLQMIKDPEEEEEQGS